MKRAFLLTVVALAIVTAYFLFRINDSVPASVSAVSNASPPEPEIPLSATSTISQRLVSPKTTRAEPTTNAAAPATNRLARLFEGEGDPQKITREQADAFANTNGRRADALLAAWAASGELSFLREAIEKYPKDPHVAYMAWCKANALDPDRPDEARSERLKKFKEAAPDNAIANYLSARERFKAGDVASAMSELSAAEHKPWRDYTLDAIQNAEEAYRSAGFSEAEAKAIASWGALLPHLAELRATGKSLNELAVTQRQAGDTASADAALQWSIQLGQRTGQEGTMTLIQQLVAIAIERDALTKFDPNGSVDSSGRTAQQRIAELDEQRKGIKGVAKDSGEIMPRLSEAELSMYFDRFKLFGETAAVQWAKTRVTSTGDWLGTGSPVI